MIPVQGFRRKEGDNSMSRPTLSIIDPLKVFVEYDQQYEIFVAQCLQTGHVVSADDPDTAKSMIVELLGDEVNYAIQHDDLSNLLDTPAPMEIWAKWNLAAQAKDPEERKITVQGNMPQQLRMLVGQAEVQTEVRIATGKTARSIA